MLFELFTGILVAVRAILVATLKAAATGFAHAVERQDHAPRGSAPVAVDILRFQRKLVRGPAFGDCLAPGLVVLFGGDIRGAPGTVKATAGQQVTHLVCRLLLEKKKTQER